jgi:hypothetical protein
MRQPFLAAIVTATLLVSSSAISTAQTRPQHSHALMQTTSAPVTANWGINGKWMYRSYLNLPNVVVNDDAQSAAKALSLVFGEGVMTLRSPTPGTVVGTFDMGGGYVLDLSGTLSLTPSGRTLIHMVGPGRPNTPTAGWEYDYDGELTLKWPKGINQVPAITGSVFRAKPHGTSKAGVVASFIALKQS